jgi:phage head maturation protease
LLLQQTSSLRPENPIMKIYLPIAKIDAERREVWGYASTEARDDQGEIVTRDALTAALGDYMRFANIREMHQLSAVGVAREAAVDDKGLYVGARIVDDQAWQKVVEGVYKGYSIGGRTTQRDPTDYKTITGLVLNEISLVDRPANPEAVFDYWKAAGALSMSDPRFNPPIQIWACGVPGHHHLAKADALKCQEQGLPIGEVPPTGGAVDHGMNLIAAASNPTASGEGVLEKSRRKTEGKTPHGAVEFADPGYQADGKKRYPIDTEQHIRAAWNFINRAGNAQRYSTTQVGEIKAKIIAAWKEKIDEDGPPSADETAKRGPTPVGLAKELCDVDHVMQIILDLNWLKDSLLADAEIESDGSPQPGRLGTIISELCDCLNALVTEETGEILAGSEIVTRVVAPDPQDVLTMATGAQGAALWKAKSPNIQDFANKYLTKAGRSRGDQALLDLAYHAINKCMDMDGLLFAERNHLTKARAALEVAGAVQSDLPTASTVIDPEVTPSSTGGGGVLDMIAAVLGKRAASHQALMDVAHDCIGKLTDGAVCAMAKGRARLSRDTLESLTEAHDHLVDAGASCAAPGSRPEAEPEFGPSKVSAGNMAKILAGERAERAALIATLTDIVPRLDQLAKRVEDIARMPLPPLAITKSVTPISKLQDSGFGEGGLSPDDLAAAFSRMSREEQTLTLIKASYANPIHPPGLGTANEPRGE